MAATKRKRSAQEHDAWALRAAASGALPYLKLAVELGADPNAVLHVPSDLSLECRRRSTPLIEAVVRRHAEAVKILMAAGGDPNLKVDKASALTRADARMVRLLIGAGERQKTAARDAFAEALSDEVRFDPRRDWMGEVDAWIRSGVDPYAPLFGGRSLLDLIGTLHGKTKSYDPAAPAIDDQAFKLFNDLCSKADTAERMAAAFESSILAYRMVAASRLSARGAARHLTLERKNAMLAKMDTDRGAAAASIIHSLVAEGADPKILADTFNAGRCPAWFVAEAFAADPDRSARAVDSNGRSLLWGAFARINKHPNDIDMFEENHSLAESILKHPDARVLTGNGLDTFGLPIARLALAMPDSAFSNRKRAERFDRLRKTVLDKARSEAAEFRKDGTRALDDPLPGGMNLLHLAAACGNREICKILLERAAGLGRSKITGMLAQAAPALSGSDESTKAAKPHTPLKIAGRDRNFDIVLEFARLVGFEAKSDGGSILEMLRDFSNQYDEEKLIPQIDALFAAGFDPDTTFPNGTPFHEVLKNRVKSTFHWKPAESARFCAKIEEAFTRAAGARRKPQSDPPEKQRPLSRSGVL